MTGSIRAYFLDEPLSESEVAEVTEEMGIDVVQVRIPRLLPLPTILKDGSQAMPDSAEEAPIAALKSAGILQDTGRRVCLVAPSSTQWNARFADAIGRLTGHFPYLIQTERQRRAIGNPGSLRILNLDAAF